jgi:hypothetical protein
LLNAFTFLIGLLVGNRIAIGRDRRQESNAAIQPIRARLLVDRGLPGPGRMPSAVEMDLLEHYLLPWRRRGLRAAIRRHNECCQEQERQTPSGELKYEDTAAIVNRIDNVLCF